MEKVLNMINNNMFITILTGVIVFIISQYFLEFIIKPRLELKRLKQKTGATLIMYRNVDSNPIKYNAKTDGNLKYNEAGTKIREIASELSGYIGIISRVHCNKRKKLITIRDDLIGLSNGVYTHDKEYKMINDNLELENEIIKLLGINIDKKRIKN